ADWRDQGGGYVKFDREPGPGAGTGHVGGGGRFYWWEIGGGEDMRQKKNQNALKKHDFSPPGQTNLHRAQRICHQRHLDGEFDPDWQSCLQQAQKIALPKFMSVKEKGGYNEWQRKKQ